MHVYVFMRLPVLRGNANTVVVHIGGTAPAAVSIRFNLLFGAKQIRWIGAGLNLGGFVGSERALVPAGGAGNSAIR